MPFSKKWLKVAGMYDTIVWLVSDQAHPFFYLEMLGYGIDVVANTHQVLRPVIFAPLQPQQNRLVQGVLVGARHKAMPAQVEIGPGYPYRFTIGIFPFVDPDNLQPYFCNIPKAGEGFVLGL